MEYEIKRVKGKFLCLFCDQEHNELAVFKDKAGRAQILMWCKDCDKEYRTIFNKPREFSGRTS